MSKIGVFVCHCGENIGATVDCEKVAAEIAKMDGVEVSMDYKYMCSDPGQTLIKDAIRQKGLDGVVVAACSPRMHEATFRKACAEACLNPYLCEIANIREQCSWVHEKGEATTEKAIELVRMQVEKVRRDQPLRPIEVPITKKALVIGGGISGAAELFLPQVQERIARMVYSRASKVQTLLRPAKFGNDAGIVGAARLGDM